MWIYNKDWILILFLSDNVNNDKCFITKHYYFQTPKCLPWRKKLLLCLNHSLFPPKNQAPIRWSVRQKMEIDDGTIISHKVSNAFQSNGGRVANTNTGILTAPEPHKDNLKIKCKLLNSILVPHWCLVLLHIPECHVCSLSAYFTCHSSLQPAGDKMAEYGSSSSSTCFRRRLTDGNDILSLGRHVA